MLYEVITGANALASAYETALERAPAETRIYTRALHWARSCFPDPHTAIEAEQFRAAIEEAESRLARITSYNVCYTKLLRRRPS